MDLHSSAASGDIAHPCTKFHQNPTIRGWIIDDRTNFPAHFFRVNYVTASSQGCVDRTVPNLVKTYDPSKAFNKFALDFRYATPFRNQTALKAKSLTFTSRKIRAGLGAIAECESSTLPMPVLDSRFLLRFENRALQRRLSKIEAKFPTFWSHQCKN